jgi:nucleoside-diphosphate-sugar epimerase
MLNSFTPAALEERLSRPTPLSIDAMARMEGGLLILGAGGKMGRSLAVLARRSSDATGSNDRKIVAVSRFSSSGLRAELEADGVETIAGDLLDESVRRSLPQLPNVLIMVGYKFSKNEHPSRYWAINVYLPGLLADRFRESRIVAFSTGNVYPWTAADGPMPTEDTPCQPVGEYALTCWGRERILDFKSRTHGTPTALLRLNYAVEARYGVLVDLALDLLAGRPVSLAVPAFNCVWQGYANAVALSAFRFAESPPAILNVTGEGRHTVRDIALRLADKLSVQPRFTEPEGESVLLSDAKRCHTLFGPPEVSTDQLIDLVSGWLRAGGATLEKPTRFQATDGAF